MSIPSTFSIYTETNLSSLPTHTDTSKSLNPIAVVFAFVAATITNTVLWTVTRKDALPLSRMVTTTDVNLFIPSFQMYHLLIGIFMTFSFSILVQRKMSRNMFDLQKKGYKCASELPFWEGMLLLVFGFTV